MPITGDASIAAGGALTVTKSNGIPFGTAAFASTGSSGPAIPLLNGANTWSGVQSLDNGDLALLGSTSGDSLLEAPPSGGGTVTFFAGSDTVIGAATTQTLTNKSISCAANTCTSIPTSALTGTLAAANMLPLATNDVYQGNGSNQSAAVSLSAAIDASIGNARGSILERGSGGWALITPGTSSYVLTSNGSGSDPSWQASTGGSTTIDLGTGITNTAGTQNTGSQTITNGSAVYPQNWTAAYTSNHTVAVADGVQTYVANGSGALTFTLDGTGAASAGNGFCFADKAGYGYTLASGTSATFYGQPGISESSITLPPDTYACASFDGTNWALGATGLSIQAYSVGWTAGVNPNSAVIVADLPYAITITSLVGSLEVPEGAAATVSVYEAPSGTACVSGTVLHSGSFNANGTKATNQSLTLTTTAVPAGDRLCLQTTGTWSGSSVGTITVYGAPS